MNKLTEISVALVGNPNVGKSSLFNQLTGLRQKVGNFPGVTVDKKVGYASLDQQTEVKITDFPGAYSLYPTSLDERVVLNVFTNPDDKDYPEVVVYVADITNLEKHLLLLYQIRDLGLPVVLALTMEDLAEKEHLECDIKLLSDKIGIPVIKANGRTGKGIDKLKETILKLSTSKGKESTLDFLEKSAVAKKISNSVQEELKVKEPYRALLLAHHCNDLNFIPQEDKKFISSLKEKENFKSISLQIEETMQRYDNTITPLTQKVIQKANKNTNLSTTDKIDNILTNRFFGPLIFFGILLFVFQAIFSWSELPMTLIEEGFNSLATFAKDTLPEGWFTDLLTDGIIAGLGGVLVFIPQITILFFLISILEEVGYMARAVFMFDRIMQKFGMNGRSVVALISGGACAIPAVMATRTISNWKERLITIMVTPLISCSARIPVFAILVSFAVPATTIWGVFNLQALTFIGLYILGAVSALASAYVMKLIFKTNESSFLMLELPEYRSPHWKNVFINVYEKVASFITEAGQVIIVVSIILWALASYGPGNEMEIAEKEAIASAQTMNLDEMETADLIASRQIEVSYAGKMGKFIEPVIAPLGFDWKIGIALISSFAAREVFVGTMATIYSIGSVDDESTVQAKMGKEVNPITGEKIFNPATSFSLLIFYVFAMQCMGTLAIVKKETKSWKWPIIQIAYMGGLAYFGSLIVYLLMS